MKVTKKALEEGIRKFNETRKPIPFYDSDDPKTRKQIGEVVDIHLDPECQTQLGFVANLYDGKIVKGNTCPQD